MEKEQSTARARLEQATDAYMRDRLHDLDDLSNRLLRILTGQGKETGADMPADPILIASNIGPAELLDYGRSLKGIVLEEDLWAATQLSWPGPWQYRWLSAPKTSRPRR